MCSFEWNDKEKRMKEERRRGIGKSNKLLFCVYVCLGENTFYSACALTDLFEKRGIRNSNVYECAR